LLVVDENTFKAQGESLANALTSANKPFDVLQLAPPPDRDELVCDTALVEQVANAVREPASGDLAPPPRPSVVGLNVPVSDSSLTPSPTHPLPLSSSVSALIAVGSGTICDTVKLAAAATKLPSAAVATATSMNGYPSVIAAVLREGVKRTDPANPPIVVLADLDVLCHAPARMIAAGMADLLAKPVSTADWTLANALLGDPISLDGLTVVEQSAMLADGIAPELPPRKPEAIARLFEALFVSGLAMAVSGASSPASGGEHLISHYLDMTALAGRGVADAETRGRGDAGTQNEGAKAREREGAMFSPTTEGRGVACDPKGSASRGVKCRLCTQFLRVGRSKCVSGGPETRFRRLARGLLPCPAGTLAE
jgi:hypothetical protein